MDPEPDAAVVRATGRRSAAGDQVMPGGGTDLTFTFEATGAGRTEIVLMHCTYAGTCDTGDGTPAPAPTGERVTYRVTVR
ncbi:hypothetical protein [Streptomyces cinereospinus]|uniref:Proteinase inhibitor I42 chagasin domain-containing protein n=1 Tax=Streptomyces cinereospinus TaxID=285561 RepID=A0ABV5N6Y6_9ACTN